MCYWFEKARAAITDKKAKRSGLISTNSIRGGANRVVLERIKKTGDIFMAWSDNPWMLEGAAVRVSMVGFDDGSQTTRTLDGNPTDVINADLTGSLDITVASILAENRDISFQGPSPKGKFDITPDVAKEMLLGSNESGLPNSDVVKPVVSAVDIAEGSRGLYTIDFGLMDEDMAKRYKLPYAYVLKHVYPVRSGNNRLAYAQKWWQYAEARPGMRNAIKTLSRFLVTPAHAKFRVFIWVDQMSLVNQACFVFAREDDYFFGVLHSYIHEVWALRMGTWLGKGNDPRYTPTTTFETFPFPVAPGREDFSDERVKAVGAAAAALHSEREAWLNPPGLEEASTALQKSKKTLSDRTLTEAYNAVQIYRAYAKNAPHAGEGANGSNGSKKKKSEAARNFAPRLIELHDALDVAVLGLYGWPDLIGQLRTPEGDEELLRRLLAENARRAGE